MSKTATLLASLGIVGDGDVDNWTLPPIITTGSPAQRMPFVTASGANVFTVPPGFTSVQVTLAVLPPAASSISKTIGGVSFAPNQLIILPLAAGVTSITLTSGGIETLTLIWF